MLSSTEESQAEFSTSPSLSKVYSGSTKIFSLMRQVYWGPELLNLGLYPSLGWLGFLINGLRTISTAQRRLVNHAIALIGVEAGDHVVDIACGRGGSSFMLRHSTPAASVHAIDLLAENIEMAKCLFPADDRLFYTRADAQFLPFPDGMFHKALCCEAAFHFPDRGRFLMETHRVLQSQGRLVVVDFVWRTPAHRACRTQSMGQIVRNIWGWDDMSSECEYKAMAEQAGLQLVRSLDWTATVTRAIQQRSECAVWLSKRAWGRGILKRLCPMLSSFTESDWSQLEIEVAAHRFLHDNTYYKAMVFQKP